MATPKNHGFVLCRSDKGDGGWSLHAPESTDEDIANGNSPPLNNGTAKRTASGWDRPNEADYQIARVAYAFS